MEDFIELSDKINKEFLNDKNNLPIISKNVMEYELSQVNVKTNIEYQCLIEIPNYLLTFKDEYLKILGIYNYDLLAEFLINGFIHVNNKSSNKEMNEYLKNRYSDICKLISVSIYLKRMFSHLIIYIKKQYNKDFLLNFSVYNNQKLNSTIDHLLFHNSTSSIVHSKKNNSIDEIISNYLEYEMNENDKIGEIIDTKYYQNAIIDQYKFVINELNNFINSKDNSINIDDYEFKFYLNIAIIFKEFMEMRIVKLKMPTINNFIIETQESNNKSSKNM